MTATARYLMPAQHAGGLAPARFELKSVSDDGEFEGYASLFNREDLGHDVIAPGAFYDSLAGRDVNAIKMLFQHNASEPIGVWEVIREDAKGLYVKGRLMTAVAKAREVLALMRAGALDGLSIGFKAVKARRDARSGVRRIEKVDLWEISVVTFPMLPGARVEAVKKRPFVGRAPSERDFERWLTRDAGLSRNEARAVTRQGYSGLKTVRSAGGFAVRIRDASARIENETARLNVPGGLRLSDLKSGALRVEGDVAYVRMLAAIERLKVVTELRDEKFNPFHDSAGRFTTADGAGSGGSNVHLANARRPPRQVRIGNRIYDATNSTQETELILVAQRAENALSRVRELDPSWQAAPSLSDPQSASGAIAAYRSLAQQAEGRATVLERGGVPLRFNTARDFESFGRATRDGLAAANHRDAEPYIRGSAVTGYNYLSGEPFDVGRRSDYDLAIVSPTLMRRAQEFELPPVLWTRT